MDSSFCASTSKPCVLYIQKVSSISRPHPSPQLRQAGRIQTEVNAHIGGRFAGAADFGRMRGKIWTGELIEYMYTIPGSVYNKHFAHI